MMRMPLHQHGVTTKNANDFEIRGITICCGNSYAHKLSDEDNNLQSQLATAKACARNLTLLCMSIYTIHTFSLLLTLSTSSCSSAVFCEKIHLACSYVHCIIPLVSMETNGFIIAWRSVFAMPHAYKLQRLVPFNFKIAQSKVRQAWNSLLQFVEIIRLSCLVKPILHGKEVSIP